MSLLMRITSRPSGYSRVLNLILKATMPTWRGHECTRKRACFFRRNLFIYFWPHCTACRTLVPRPGIEPTPPAVEVQGLNHWTAREVPQEEIFLKGDSGQGLGSVSFFFLILLKYSWFTMLCSFLLYSKATQFFTSFPPGSRFISTSWPCGSSTSSVYVRMSLGYLSGEPHILKRAYREHRKEKNLKSSVRKYIFYCFLSFSIMNYLKHTCRKINTQAPISWLCQIIIFP